MCGIAGIVSSRRQVDEQQLIAMRDAMTHRGPDDAGAYLNADRTVGLGHRRLSIIDLSANGHQPMSNEDGTVWVTYNGEIYNFEQIRDELLEAGHTFRSRTDSEVIVHAYEEWGVACLQRFRGMFAFAVWDESRGRLFMARDRMGIKPLYYAHRNGDLLFASELKGLTANTSLSLTTDPTAVYDFFTYNYVPTPKTIYAEARKLPPGHYATFEDGRLTIAEYWDAEFREDGPATEPEAAEFLLDKLKDAIDSHLVSDVPLGVLLSGGLDSSTIAALAASGRVGLSHTFTIGFDVAQHDERAYARQVAERYGTDHRELEVTNDSTKGSLEEIIAVYDEPFADSSTLPTLSVCKLARREVTVALSGEGGDEIFGGYSRYSDWLKLATLDFVPSRLRSGLLGVPARLLPRGFKGKWSLETASLDPIARYAELLSATTRRQKSAIFSPRFLAQFADYDDHWYFRQYWRSDLDRWSRMQYLDLKTYLHDDILTKMDRASMSVSLEARVPLLDHELVEAVVRLPRSVRNKGWVKKHLLKVTMKDYLPPALLTKRKQGFSAPFHAWHAGRRELPYIHDNGVFDVAALRNGPVSRREFWKLNVMNGWLQANE